MSEYIIENAERVAFWEMRVEDQNAILRAKIDYPDSVELLANKWKKSGDDGICFSATYRVRALDTPLVIPWEIIHKDWQWAAMDADKRIYFYENEPHCQSAGWNGESLIAIAEILSIDTAGIDWRRSKTRRPV